MSAVVRHRALPVVSALRQAAPSFAAAAAAGVGARAGPRPAASRRGPGARGRGPGARPQVPRAGAGSELALAAAARRSGHRAPRPGCRGRVPPGPEPPGGAGVGACRAVVEYTPPANVDFVTAAVGSKEKADQRHSTARDLA